jgi:hypothetical protein
MDTCLEASVDDMSRIKMEKGVSRVMRVLSHAAAEKPIAADIAVMSKCSNNATNYAADQPFRLRYRRTKNIGLSNSTDD